MISRDDLILFFSEAASRLEDVLLEANQFRSRQRGKLSAYYLKTSYSVLGLSSEVAVLLRILSEKADNVSSARETVEKIAALIASRLNSSVVTRVENTSLEVQLLLELANRLISQAETNAEDGRNLTRRLTGVGSGLTAAENVAAEVLRVAREAAGVARDAAAVEEILTVS